MWKDFKKFAIKGNVIDLAVAVIIGGAFGLIVKSLVNDIIMPLVGKLLGGTDFSNLFIVLGPGSYNTLVEAQEAGAATLNYGLFINTIINFLIISFSIFLVIKLFEKAKKKEEPAPAAPTTKKCPYCITEISIEATKCPNCTSDLNG
ncbi:MAG: large conductance mechanosensitive channel protein MscL [Clostridia bacterium]|nr:large conductance mechanosensitive channel protein MscL [Clostridia bacterium]MBN2883363.1 large conductance mechanosensitive channel protein MscL [Clostridia bacterium]